MNELIYLTCLTLVMFTSMAVFIVRPKDFLAVFCAGVDPLTIETYYRKWLLTKDGDQDPAVWKTWVLLGHTVTFLLYGFVIFTLEAINVYQYLVLFISMVMLALVFVMPSKQRTIASYWLSAIGCILFIASFI